MKKALAAVALTGALIFAGVGVLSAKEKAKAVKAEKTFKALKAICHLSPTKGNQVKGTVEFIQEKDGVRVKVVVEGLTPGKHGFHIHEAGDCSAPDGASAKGHFNPAMHDHGKPSGKVRHAGDLGNLDANSMGRAKYDHLDKMIRLEGKDSIIGKGVIVHAGEDDFKTQPTGNSGARVACGVITSVKR